MSKRARRYRTQGAPGLRDRARRLAAILPNHVADARIDATIFAAILGVSRGTLQRRLAESGTRFGKLRGSVRFEQAARLIAAGDASITRISRSLGYSDSSNFARAFRNRFGCSPSAHGADRVTR